MAQNLVKHGDSIINLESIVTFRDDNGSWLMRDVNGDYHRAGTGKDSSGYRAVGRWVNERLLNRELK